MDHVFNIVHGRWTIGEIAVEFDPTETSAEHAAELQAEELGYDVDYVAEGNVYVRNVV